MDYLVPYNSVAIVFLSAIVGMIVTGIWNGRASRKAKAEAVKEVADKMSDKIKNLEKDLATLTATFTPISAAFQAVLIKQLTHFHTPEMDELLRKAERGELSNSEDARLREMLISRAEDLDGRIDSSEREAALMLPLVMNRVRLGAAAVDSEVMVVLVPKDKAK